MQRPVQVQDRNKPQHPLVQRLRSGEKSRGAKEGGGSHAACRVAVRAQGMLSSVFATRELSATWRASINWCGHDLAHSHWPPRDACAAQVTKDYVQAEAYYQQALALNAEHDLTLQNYAIFLHTVRNDDARAQGACFVRASGVCTSCVARGRVLLACPASQSSAAFRAHQLGSAPRGSQALCRRPSSVAASACIGISRLH